MIDRYEVETNKSKQIHGATFSSIEKAILTNLINAVNEYIADGENTYMVEVIELLNGAISALKGIEEYMGPYGGGQEDW